MNLEKLNEFRELAKSNADGGEDIRDTVVRELVLRRRGNSLSFLFKTRSRSLKIGNAMLLGLKDAREQAKYRAAHQEEIDERKTKKNKAAASITLNEMILLFLKYRSEPIYRASGLSLPKPATLRDMRLSFNRSALLRLRQKPVAEITRQDLVNVRDKIYSDHSQKQSNKAVTYLRSAFNFGRNHLPEQTQLDDTFWNRVQLVELVGDDAIRGAENRRPLANSDFGPEEVGRFLKIHRSFCERNKVSFAVRLCTELIMFTGQRAHAATNLKMDNFQTWKGLPTSDWRLLRWDADQMKGGVEFALPIPPAVVDVVEEAVLTVPTFSCGDPEKSLKWKTFVFETRPGMPIGDSALRQHLSRLRGWVNENGKKIKCGPDLLADLPRFSLHTVRSSIATYLDDQTTITAGASSAVLAHIAQHQRQIITDTSSVTEKHYSSAQRISLKAQGMEAWVEAVLRHTY